MSLHALSEKYLADNAADVNNRIGIVAAPGNDPAFGGHRVIGNYTQPIAGATNQYDLSRFNPFHVETLLDRAFRLVETCLQLRIEYADYDVIDKKWDADLGLSREMRRVDVWLESELEKQEARGSSILAEQGEIKKTGELLQPTEPSLEAATFRQGAVKKASTDRREVYEKSEKAEVARRDDPLDGANFKLRKSGVAERYAEIEIETTCVCLALSDGMKLVYGEDTPTFPKFSEPDYLDELLVWLKLVLAKLEVALRRDSEYGLSVSLKTAKDKTGYIVSQWSSDAAANTTRAVKTLLAFESLKFKLDKDFWFPDQSYIRLRGVSVYVSSTSAGYDAWRVSLTSPIPSIGTSAAAPKLPNVPRLHFADVTDRVNAARGTQLSLGSLFNLDPTLGAWELRIDGPSMQGGDFKTITDIEVLFRVAGLS